MRTLIRLLTLLLITFVLGLTVDAAPQGKIENPDLTTGQPIPEGATHDWNLGATGARGWMFSDRLTTLTARQIAVTKIHPGSPADGVLKVGDVILGVDGKPFSYDPRTEFGKALTLAETQAGKGQLVVRRFREGQTQDVTIQLPVLGSYSATAPYNCEKSKRIFEQGCEALAKTMADPRYRGNAITRSLNAMALLASGEQKYMPLVQREAQWAADFRTTGFATWWYGYTIMFLGEYVIATGDQSVMPGLERQALEAADGQSIVGSWGHGFAKPNGILGGYGMMNAPGVPLTTGLVLAREAGVKNPKLDLAIDRSVKLIRFYVDKGSIPYGDHDAWIQTHDDNGKNGMAAVLFNLLGDREAAEYYSRMSVATHGNERDCGHTGNFLNMTWAMPGINPSGPHAAGAWMKEFGAWYYDLARQWDGTYLHQGPPQPKTDSYKNWDCTGAYLLAYAMPLKKLRITGKGKNVVPLLSMKQAQELIEDGRGWNNLDRNSFYDALTTEQLLERLSSWSPVVRERAAEALGRRKAPVQPQLIELLKSKDRYARYGACKAFKYVRGDNSLAIPVLVQAFEAEDIWLRILAAQGLAGIGDQARSAIPAMLTRLAQANADIDPRKMEQRYLSFALFNRRGGLLSRSLEGVDRDLLREAVRAGLLNQDGRARGAIATVYDQLTFEEIKPLLPAIHSAVVEPAPSGIMFADQVRIEGLKLLAKHRIEEGIEACVSYLYDQNPWGSQKRVPEILQILLTYGSHAASTIPALQRLADDYGDGEPNFPMRLSKEKEAAVRDAIEKIKQAENKPDLIRMGGPRVGAR